MKYSLKNNSEWRVYLEEDWGGCKDLYDNEESFTLKELPDETLEGYLEDCLSYILICYSSRCITVRGIWICV